LCDVQNAQRKRQERQLPRRPLPDFASQLVTVRSAVGTRTVVRHGGCSARFNAVYRTLATAVGLR
jgi:hypothetical protein